MPTTYYPPSQNGLQKTLGAQLDQGVTASLTLNNTTGVQNKPGVVLINRIDSNGSEKSASLREFIIFTGTSGSTLTGLTRGVAGSTDQDHAVGSVVEFIWDITQYQALVDYLLVNHVVDTGLHDFNGTEVIIDANGDTSMTADTDDQIDWKLGGSDRFRMKTSDFDIVTSTGNITVNAADPKRGIYIPASAMITRTTNGAASGSSETTTNKVMIKSFDFDASTDEYVQFQLPSPKYWDAGTITAEFYWTAASGSGDVVFGIQGLALSNDDALDTAFGTAQTVTDTLITANDVHVTSATSAMTLAGSPVAGDWVIFQIYRDADAAGDTLAVDAKLLGVRIAFSRGKYDDQ